MLQLEVTRAVQSWFGQRREPRQPTEKDVILTYADPARGGLYRGKVVNESSTGFGVQHWEPLEVGSKVMLVHQSQILDCSVVWCRRNGNGCSSGLRIAA